MKKRVMILALTIAIIVQVFSGCTAKQDSGRTIISWAIFETDNYTPEFWQNIIDQYEKEYPNIKIEKVLMTGDSRQAFLKTAYNAGNFPDINVDPVDLATIDGVYATVPDHILALYEDAAWATFNGKKNLVPACKTYRMQVYYHKKVFEDNGIGIPTNWNEFVAACDKLKSKGIAPLTTAGASNLWATGQPYWAAVINPELCKKYPNFNEDVLTGKVKWNNDTLVEQLQHWQKLVNDGYYFKGSLGLTYAQATEEFLKGSAAMMIDGSWFASGLDSGDDTRKDDMGIFMMPTPNNVKAYSIVSQYWGVSAKANNVEAAFDFCAYVLGGNPDIYAKYIQADGEFSVTKNPVTYEMGPLLTKFVDNHEGYEVVPYVTRVVGDWRLPPGFEDFTYKSFQNIFQGADVVKELQSWDAEMAQLLNK